MISKDIADLARERRAMEQDIAQKEADIKIKNGEIKSLQSELDTLAATLKQLENQRGEAQKRLNDLKAQVAALVGVDSSVDWKFARVCARLHARIYRFLFKAYVQFDSAILLVYIYCEVLGQFFYFKSLTQLSSSHYYRSPELQIHLSIDITIDRFLKSLVILIHSHSLFKNVLLFFFFFPPMYVLACRELR